MNKFAGILLLLLLIAGLPASGQPLEPMATDELVASATAIIIGTVSEVRALAPEDPYENTEAVLQVERVVKGVVPNVVTLRYPGSPVTLPARGLAQAEGLAPFTLQRGDRKIFFLEGGAPYRLAHLQQGIMPVTSLPEIQSAIITFPLTITLSLRATTLSPGQLVAAVVRLRNVSDRVVMLQLPRNFAESCRFWSWSTSSQLPSAPINGLRAGRVPSGYAPVTLQPGQEVESAFRLPVAAAPRLRSAQQASLCAMVFLLQPNSFNCECLTTNPVTLTISPAK